MPETPALNSLDIGKTPEQLFAERKQRISDAVLLKQPDRIPMFLYMGYMLAQMGGIKNKDLYDNPAKTRELLVMAANRFQPDMIVGAWHTPKPSEALGDRMTNWPGVGLGPEGSFQFVEKEFMKVEDYDDFLDDPSDWAIRVYTPRVFKNLEGLSMLWPLGMWLYGYYNTLNFAGLTAPPVVAAFEAIQKAVQHTVEWIGQLAASAQELAGSGFPPIPFFNTMAEAPFDFVGDTLRGMRGIFLDMRRNPEKLLEAEEKVSRMQLKYAISNSKILGLPYAFFPLHKGSDGFMSLQQFEKFYWPQLKGMMLKLIENNITPVVFYEGKWDDRLDYLADLPKGKTVGFFQNSDIFKVKKVLGEVMCIIGGMPNSLLINGKPEEIRTYTRKVCEEVGKDGGFIFSTGVMEMYGSKPELVDAWVDAVREFGVYK
ncbi:MAG: hypothetical protein JW864_05185 [Spirochaetes bacterium]|nr:hypothetical protein [Spirochaetota bacterium]